MYFFQMSGSRLFKNAKLTWRILYPRYFSSLSNSRLNYQFFLRCSQKSCLPSYLDGSLKVAKCISNCSLMHTNDSDSSDEKSKNGEKMRKILDDDEFQNILKDFANDFGVDSETNELLEDIRKNIDESTEGDNLAASTNSNVISESSSKELPYKYKEFTDADSAVIYNSEEDYEMFEENEPLYHIQQELKPKTPYIDLKRGATGVFDIDELIKVLRSESMLDITTISIPKELHYADYLVLATAKSPRHSEAVLEFLRKLYKQKKKKKDPFMKIEGEDVEEWKAVDMGNIVLHIFLEETRILYDIESLWLLDSKFDSGGNSQPDPMLDIIEEQMAFFNSLQQSKSPDVPKDIS